MKALVVFLLGFGSFTSLSQGQQPQSIFEVKWGDTLITDTLTYAQARGMYDITITQVFGTGRSFPCKVKSGFIQVTGKEIGGNILDGGKLETEQSYIDKRGRHILWDATNKDVVMSINFKDSMGKDQQISISFYVTN